MEPIPSILKTLLQNPIQIKSKAQATQIHAQIIKSFPTLTSTLLSIYSRLNLLPESLTLFNTLPSPPFLAWKSIIKCYSSNACFLESLHCFVKMRGLGMYPDHNVFPSVLKSCTHLMCFKLGESVHACVIRVGLEFDVFTGNALLSMYSKVQKYSAVEVFDESTERMTMDQNGGKLACKDDSNESHHKTDKNCGKFLNQEGTVDELNWSGRKEGNMQMESLRRVFETIPKRDVVSYNTLISGYIQNNLYCEALTTVMEMGNVNLKPDAFTLSSIVPIFAECADVHKGKEIHGYALRHGFDRNGFIGSGLIDMYASCNMVQHSCRLFHSLPVKDSVSWCSIIAACVQNGMFDEGLRFFRQMLGSNIKPVPVSLSSIIPACADLTTLPLGQQLHGYIIRGHFDDNPFVASSLVHMYARCGNIKIARWVYDNMVQHDLVSWTAMIMGCALHGHAYDAISLFEQMETEGIRPNSVAFVAVLTACSHAGLVNEGFSYFNSMVKHYSITPEFEHYACMADLLGRAGKLEEAFGFICSMPNDKTSSIWLPLLAACRVHKNIELAEKVATRVFETDSENLSAHVLLANTYSAVGRYKDSAKVRSMSSKKGTRKKPACSWIGIGNQVHGFIAEDKSHPSYDRIINELDTLIAQMGNKKYVVGST